MSARDAIAQIIYRKLLGVSMDQEPVHQVLKSGSFDSADAILTALKATARANATAFSAEIITLRAEVERLTRERDAKDAERNTDGGLWRFWNTKAKGYLARAEVAEAEVARLMKVINEGR